MAIKVKYTSQLKRSAKQGIILYKSVSMVALVPLLSSYNFVYTYIDFFIKDK